MWEAAENAPGGIHCEVVSGRRVAVEEALRRLLNTVVCVNTSDGVCAFLLDLNDATYRIVVSTSLINEIYGFYFHHSDEKSIYPFLNKQGLFEEWKIYQECRKINVKAAIKMLDWAKRHGDKRWEKSSLEDLNDMGYKPEEENE